MIDQNAQFEALRALLLQPASTKVWDALCEHLASWPAGDAKELGLAYTLSHLDHWDDRLRQGPIDLWWPTFPKGTPRPEWTIVRALRLDEPHIYMRPKASEPPAPAATENITSFQLMPHNTTIDAYIAFIEGLHLHSLRALHIEHHQLGEASLKALLKRPWFSSLSRLDIAYNNLGVSGMSALLETLAYSDLSWLNVRANHLDNVALDALVDSPLFPNLMHLDIGFNELVDAKGMERLLGMLSPGQLQTLRVDGMPIRGNDWTPVFTSHPALAGLSTLSASRSQLGDTGIIALAASPYFAELETLNISHNRITYDGAHALSRSRFLQRLTSLTLSHNPIGAAGLQAITSSPYLQALTQLHLKGIKF